MWLAFSKGLGLHGLWIGLSFSLIYCATWGVYLCFQTDWQREVLKVMDRLAEDQKRGNHEIERQG
jgi:multidrug resistance protein, MATE family